MTNTLTVAMLIYNAGARLHALCADARTYADELVLGVDDSSDPLTIDLSRRLADTMFLWPHTPFENTYRMGLIGHATSDWVCVLDDDERLGGDRSTLRQLLSTRRHTHYWLARQWVASLDPLTYFDAAPWWPDWQMRLIRRGAPQISHSAEPHSIYRVEGTSDYLTEWPIWHYDRVVRTSLEREVKLARYREQGMQPGGILEQYYCGEGAVRPLPPEAHPEYPLISREGPHDA